MTRVSESLFAWSRRSISQSKCSVSHIIYYHTAVTQSITNNTNGCLADTWCSQDTQVNYLFKRSDSQWAQAVSSGSEVTYSDQVRVCAKTACYHFTCHLVSRWSHCEWRTHSLGFVHLSWTHSVSSWVSQLSSAAQLQLTSWMQNEWTTTPAAATEWLTSLVCGDSWNSRHFSSLFPPLTVLFNCNKLLLCVGRVCGLCL